MRTFTAAQLPELPVLTAVSQGVKEAVISTDNAVTAMEKAMQKAQDAHIRMVDLLRADGWRSGDTLSPAEDVREDVVTRGEKEITKLVAYQDLHNLATICCDAKTVADSEPDKDGVKFSAAQIRYHLRTSTLPKDVAEGMTSEEKARRRKIRQQIAAYLGNFRTALERRERNAGEIPAVDAKKSDAKSDKPASKKGKGKGKGKGPDAAKTVSIVTPQAGLDALIHAMLQIEDADLRMSTSVYIEALAENLGLDYAAADDEEIPMDS